MILSQTSVTQRTPRRRLDSGFSRRNLGFGPIRARFVLGPSFCPSIFGFSLFIIIHNCSVLIHLPLPSEIYDSSPAHRRLLSLHLRPDTWTIRIFTNHPTCLQLEDCMGCISNVIWECPATRENSTAKHYQVLCPEQPENCLSGT